MIKTKTFALRTLIIFIFILYVVSDLFKVIFNNSTLSAVLSISVILLITGFAILVQIVAGMQKRFMIFILTMIGFMLICGISGAYTLKNTAPALILRDMAFLSLPIFIVLSQFLLINNKEYRTAYSVSILACAGVYIVTAVVGFFLGYTFTTRGFDPSISGWFAGTGALGAILLLASAAIVIRSKRIILSISAFFIMTSVVFFSGSKHAIALVIAGMLLLLACMLVRQMIFRTARFHIVFYILFTLVLAISPLFYARTARTVNSIPRFVKQEQVADDKTLTWKEVSGSNSFLGYIPYRDRYELSRIELNTRISDGITQSVLNEYTTSRLNMPVEKVGDIELKNKQFTSASLKRAGLWQRLFGYGSYWLEPFAGKIENGILYLLNCYGIAGLLSLLFPLTFVVWSNLKQAKGFCGFLKLPYVFNILVFCLSLYLLISFGGIVLYPFMILLMYIPLLYSDSLLERKSAPLSNYAEKIKELFIRDKWKVGALTIGCLLAVTFIGSAMFYYGGAVKAASGLYKAVYYRNWPGIEQLKKIRPEKYKPVYKAPKKTPMHTVEPSGPYDADEFVKGRYLGYVFGDSIDWDLPGVENVSHQYSFYSMFWLYGCIESYNQTGDSLYPEKAIPAMMSWIDKYSVRSRSDAPYVWNDDSTARRAYHIEMAYKVWENFLTSEQREKITRSINYHMELLSRDDFYTWISNHGLFQDRGLLTCSLTFENPLSLKYQAIVKDRIIIYAQNYILPDGVNVEHSPSYHVYVGNLIGMMANMFEDIDSEYKQMILDRYVMKMSDYAVHMTRPNGTFPPVGDTNVDFVMSPHWSNDPYYQYICSNGEEGKIPEETDRIFPYGGYAFFRDSWSFNESKTWMMFNAAAHGRVHKHCDDLSFSIWHNGNLFVDSGTGGYDLKNDPFSVYGLSAWAHSRLISNWKKPGTAERWASPHPYYDYYAKKTKLTEWELTDSCAWVSGEQEYIRGIRQTRRLEWDKIENVVTINDTVTSDKKDDHHVFLFHLAEDIKPVIENDSVVLYRGDKIEAVMRFNASHQKSVDLYFGGDDEFIKAFNALTGAPRYVVAVSFNNISSELNLQTTIELSK